MSLLTCPHSCAVGRAGGLGGPEIGLDSGNWEQGHGKALQSLLALQARNVHMGAWGCPRFLSRPCPSPSIFSQDMKDTLGRYVTACGGGSDGRLGLHMGPEGTVTLVST